MGKERVHIDIMVIGHVDSGNSTTIRHLAALFSPSHCLSFPHSSRQHPSSSVFSLHKSALSPQATSGFSLTAIISFSRCLPSQAGLKLQLRISTPFSNPHSLTSAPPYLLKDPSSFTSFLRRRTSFTHVAHPSLVPSNNFSHCLATGSPSVKVF